MLNKSGLLTLTLTSAIAMGVNAATKEDAEWKTRMRALAASMGELIPLVSDPSKFNDLASQKKIETSVDSLAKLAKDLKGSLQKHGKANDNHAADPIFPFMATAFEDDISNAQYVLKNGDRKYAQHLLQNSLSYCTSCHTRAENKSNFKFPMFAESFDKMKIFDQIKLLAASRQFEKALDVFSAQLESGKIQSADPLDIEQATRLSVAIAVRVNRDLDKAIAQAEQVRTIEKVPTSFKEELAGWVTGIKDLKKLPQAAPKTEKALFDNAKTMVERAQAKQKSVVDRSADIDYLRATALLHDLIEKYPKSPYVGESLYLLGTSYNTLQQLGFWSLHEAYFEACIRKTPHSSLAKKCFDDLKESVTFGYTGSSGINIPPNVQRKLADLNTIATSAKK